MIYIITAVKLAAVIAITVLGASGFGAAERVKKPLAIFNRLLRIDGIFWQLIDYLKVNIKGFMQRP
jgi:hypothetical protein